MFEYMQDNQISLLKKVGKLHFFFVKVYFSEAGFLHHLGNAPCDNTQKTQNCF